ncbi:MAG: hypothetical protein JNM85_03670 [Chthonomonas sp.]|nr:hypothetical protein [Chthonomonas sp.]
MSNPADKKKVLIVGAMVVVLAGIGAFQFMGSGSSTAAKATKKVTKSSKANHVKASEEPKTIAGSDGALDNAANPVAPEAVDEGINPHNATNVGTDEAGTLGTTDADTAQNVATTQGVESSLKSDVALSPLDIRDPFSVPAPARDKERTREGNKPALAVTQPNTNPTTMKGPGRNAEIARNVAAGAAPLPPLGLEGLPPVVPGGAITGQPTAKAGGPKLAPSTPLRVPDEYAYSLMGVVQGTSPLAILQDDSGSQRMVRLGGELGGGKIVAIRGDRVVVEHKGKKVTLRIGGGSGKTN